MCLLHININLIRFLLKIRVEGNISTSDFIKQYQDVVNSKHTCETWAKLPQWLSKGQTPDKFTFEDIHSNLNTINSMCGGYTPSLSRHNRMSISPLALAIENFDGQIERINQFGNYNSKLMEKYAALTDSIPLQVHEKFSHWRKSVSEYSVKSIAEKLPDKANELQSKYNAAANEWTELNENITTLKTSINSDEFLRGCNFHTMAQTINVFIFINVSAVTRGILAMTKLKEFIKTRRDFLNFLISEHAEEIKESAPVENIVPKQKGSKVKSIIARKSKGSVGSVANIANMKNAVYSADSQIYSDPEEMEGPVDVVEDTFTQNNDATQVRQRDDDRAASSYTAHTSNQRTLNHKPVTNTPIQKSTFKRILEKIGQNDEETVHTLGGNQASDNQRVQRTADSHFGPVTSHVNRIPKRAFSDPGQASSFKAPKPDTNRRNSAPGEIINIKPKGLIERLFNTVLTSLGLKKDSENVQKTKTTKQSVTLSKLQ